MSDHTVQIDGLQFHCRIDGPEGAPWLVFSNSLLTDLTMWDPQVAALSGRFRILRYDQRGHGKTSVPPGPSHFDRLADDAEALLAHFGIERAVFIGISMGAATTLALASRHPGRLAALVACDGQSKSPSSSRAAWDERIALARAQGMAALAQVTVPRWFLPASVSAGGPAIENVAAMIRATPFEGFVSCARALQDFDYDADLPGITLPTLLMVGAGDGVLPTTMRAMQAKIPGARFVEIPEAGHLSNLEQPDAFTAALGAFLNGLA